MEAVGAVDVAALAAPALCRRLLGNLYVRASTMPARWGTRYVKPSGHFPAEAATVRPALLVSAESRVGCTLRVTMVPRVEPDEIRGDRHVAPDPDRAVLIDGELKLVALADVQYVPDLFGQCELSLLAQLRPGGRARLPDPRLTD